MSPLLSTFAGASALGYGFTRGASAPAGAFELISTTSGSGSSSSITISSIPSTYKHLQLRFSAIGTTDAYQNIRIQFNGDTAANYSWHAMYGQNNSGQAGNTTSANWIKAAPGDTGLTTLPNTGIIDVLDYADTTKFKTSRQFTGTYRSTGYYGDVGLGSGNWRSTSAINSITFFVASANFATTTRLSLYGIKGV